MLDKRIKFDEAYHNEEEDIMTLYFMGPAEIIKKRFPGKYPEAISTEISVEISIGSRPLLMEARFASVEISPTKQIGDSMLDYDWTEACLPVEDVESLIKIAEKADVFSTVMAN